MPRWSGDEIARLHDAVTEIGQDWRAVANMMVTRDQAQCRNRWMIELKAKTGTVAHRTKSHSIRKEGIPPRRIEFEDAYDFLGDAMGMFRDWELSEALNSSFDSFKMVDVCSRPRVKSILTVELHGKLSFCFHSRRKAGLDDNE